MAFVLCIDFQRGISRRLHELGVLHSEEEVDQWEEKCFSVGFQPSLPRKNSS